MDNDVIPFYYTGKIINGKFDGPWKGYFDASGIQTSAEGRTVMGKREGEYTAIIRTVRYIIACYKEDKLEGDYCSYNKDAVVTRPHGTCKYRCHYVDGKRHGLARWWYKDVTLQEEGFYKQQTKASYKSYYEGGKLNGLL